MASTNNKYYSGIDFQGENQIINMAEPVNNSDAATKFYVDDAVSGITGQLHYQGVLDASTYTSEIDNKDAGDYWVISVDGTIETIEFDVGDILLLNSDTVEATSTNFDKIDNTDLSETDVKALFSAGTGLTYTDGVFSVTAGGINTTQLANNSVDKDKINADVAGTGLGQNVDGSLEVNVDDSTVEVNTDTLQVKDGGITESKLAAAVSNKINNYYKETFGDGSTVVNTITHGLGSKDVMTQVYEISTGKCVECDVVRATTNTVEVTANPAFTIDEVRILVKRID
jgi:hypothetical protein